MYPGFRTNLGFIDVSEDHPLGLTLLQSDSINHLSPALPGLGVPSQPDILSSGYIKQHNIPPSHVKVLPPPAPTLHSTPHRPPRQPHLPPTLGTPDRLTSSLAARAVSTSHDLPYCRFPPSF